MLDETAHHSSSTLVDGAIRKVQRLRLRAGLDVRMYAHVIVDPFVEVGQLDVSQFVAGAGEPDLAHTVVDGQLESRIFVAPAVPRQ